MNEEKPCMPSIEDASKNAPAVLTYGQKAVGITFNPSNDPKVQEIKGLYARIIDICCDLRVPGINERSRLASVAITEAQTAQMWAVKAVTWKE